MSKNVSVKPGNLPSGSVVVKFATTWCGPCKMLTPKYDELQYDGIKILSINPEDVTEWSREYNFRSVPTTIGFKDNVEVFRVSGNKIDEIIHDIEEYL